MSQSTWFFCGESLCALAAWESCAATGALVGVLRSTGVHVSSLCSVQYILSRFRNNVSFDAIFEGGVPAFNQSPLRFVVSPKQMRGEHTHLLYTNGASICAMTSASVSALGRDGEAVTTSGAT